MYNKNYCDDWLKYMDTEGQNFFNVDQRMAIYEAIEMQELNWKQVDYMLYLQHLKLKVVLPNEYLPVPLDIIHDDSDTFKIMQQVI